MGEEWSKAEEINVFRVFPIDFISLSLRYPSEQNVPVRGLNASRTRFTQAVTLSASLAEAEHGSLVDGLIIKPGEVENTSPWG